MEAWKFHVHTRQNFRLPFTIDKYISKMPLNGKWRGNAEIVTFFEIYDVQIQVFDSLAAQHPIVRITTAEEGLKFSLLFSGDHYV